jgi:hypothetical protein
MLGLPQLLSVMKRRGYGGLMMAVLVFLSLINVLVVLLISAHVIDITQ